MKRVLLSLVLFLISIPGLHVLRATQEVAYQGKPGARDSTGAEAFGTTHFLQWQYY
ncbi:MAG: hypothetical protein ACR2G5_10525 [Pyrinomonadaceae bacterium]